MSCTEPYRAQTAMAIDIREERIKVGIVSREGSVLFSRRYPWETSSVAGFLDTLMLDIADFQSRTDGQWSYDRVGVSIGGWIDRETGTWLYTAKVHGFADPVPLRYLIERATGRPVFIDNDIHVSTLAENRFGIGKIYPNFTYYHIGRGIAVGVVSEGRLIRGAANYAGEYGGYLYDFGGQDSICRLEEFASGRGMVRWARSLFGQYPNSALCQADREGMLSPAKIFECGAVNDPLAAHIVHHVQRGIGLSVVSLLSFTNSEAIAFGGELAGMNGLLPALTDFIEEYCAPPTRRSLNYIGSGRLNVQEEGMIGAAWLTWEEPGPQPAGGPSPAGRAT